jgi:hypothetical protein
VYTEATTRRSAAFYARHGFETSDGHLPGYPEIIPWRPAPGSCRDPGLRNACSRSGRAGLARRAPDHGQPAPRPHGRSLTGTPASAAAWRGPVRPEPWQNLPISPPVSTVASAVGSLATSALPRPWRHRAASIAAHA